MRVGEYKKDAQCSSVFYSDGMLYSYGRHYPLLTPIQKPSGEVLLVCNARGYSVTTSKHISWCWRDADIYVHGVTTNSLDGVKFQLESELSAKQTEYDSKKRKDTKIAAMLLSDTERIKGYLAKLV